MTSRFQRCLPLIAVFAALAAACSPADDDPGGPGDARDDAGWDDAVGDVPDDGTPPPDVPIDDCAEGARWVYLVDSDTALIKFEPDALRMTEIGRLSCPSGGMTSPFSMSVDRDARAWVLYSPPLFGGTGGELFHVSTTDASCTPSGFTPGQEGFEVFGMGFVSDTAGGSEETLFVGGGSELSIGTGSAQLGWIETSSLALTPIGTIPGWPELTGTGAGELWGFFPDTSPPSVRQIDKSSGATGRTYDLPTLGSAAPEAWAFAFWGGDFYIFYKNATDPSTNVWKLETADGSVTNVLPDTGRRIVGAGVSTCAPILI